MEQQRQMEELFEAVCAYVIAIAQQRGIFIFDVNPKGIVQLLRWLTVDT